MSAGSGCATHGASPQISTNHVRSLQKERAGSLVYRLRSVLRVNVERRPSISSYLVLQTRIVSRPARARAGRILESRWYVAWIAAALALIGLVLGAIATLQILTASRPVTPSHWEHVEQLEPDDGLDQHGTRHPFDPQITVE